MLRSARAQLGFKQESSFMPLPNDRSLARDAALNELFFGINSQSNIWAFHNLLRKKKTVVIVLWNVFLMEPNCIWCRCLLCPGLQVPRRKKPFSASADLSPSHLQWWEYKCGTWARSDTLEPSWEKMGKCGQQLLLSCPSLLYCAP